jgi:hypothetical protein
MIKNKPSYNKDNLSIFERAHSTVKGATKTVNEKYDKLLVDPALENWDPKSQTGKIVKQHLDIYKTAIISLAAVGTILIFSVFLLQAVQPLFSYNFSPFVQLFELNTMTLNNALAIIFPIVLSSTLYFVQGVSGTAMTSADLQLLISHREETGYMAFKLNGGLLYLIVLIVLVLIMRQYKYMIDKPFSTVAFYNIIAAVVSTLIFAIPLNYVYYDPIINQVQFLMGSSNEAMLINVFILTFVLMTFATYINKWMTNKSFVAAVFSSKPWIIDAIEYAIIFGFFIIICAVTVWVVAFIKGSITIAELFSMVFLGAPWLLWIASFFSLGSIDVALPYQNQYMSSMSVDGLQHFKFNIFDHSAAAQFSTDGLGIFSGTFAYFVSNPFAGLLFLVEVVIFSIIGIRFYARKTKDTSFNLDLSIKNMWHFPAFITGVFLVLFYIFGVVSYSGNLFSQYSFKISVNPISTALIMGAWALYINFVAYILAPKFFDKNFAYYAFVTKIANKIPLTSIIGNDYAYNAGVEAVNKREAMRAAGKSASVDSHFHGNDKSNGFMGTKSDTRTDVRGDQYAQNPLKKVKSPIKRKAKPVPESVIKKQEKLDLFSAEKLEELSVTNTKKEDSILDTHYGNETDSADSTGSEYY